MGFKNIAIAAGVGIIVAGAASVSAATLGGITNASVGADNAVIASCDTDGIASAYATAFNATSQAYEVTGVDLSGVAAACDNLAYKVTVTDGVGGSVVEEKTGTVGLGGGSAFSVALTNPVAADSAAQIAVVITGS